MIGIVISVICYAEQICSIKTLLGCEGRIEDDPQSIVTGEREGVLSITNQASACEFRHGYGSFNEMQAFLILGGLKC